MSSLNLRITPHFLLLDLSYTWLRSIRYKIFPFLTYFCCLVINGLQVRPLSRTYPLRVLTKAHRFDRTYYDITTHVCDMFWVLYLNVVFLLWNSIRFKKKKTFNEFSSFLRSYRISNTFSYTDKMFTFCIRSLRSPFPWPNSLNLLRTSDILICVVFVIYSWHEIDYFDEGCPHVQLLRLVIRTDHFNLLIYLPTTYHPQYKEC